MFGAYQAGVWRALQSVFTPDVVVGCSVGSINGWAIASGVSGEDLAATWLDPRCSTLMRRRKPWRPWKSAFDPYPLRQMIQEMAAMYTPRVPFAVALTALPRLRLEMVQTPHLTWEHVVASCAVPVGYPAVSIDGRSYWDGGFLSVLPVWAARQLGADRAIAVNVLPNKPLSALRVAVRTVRLLAPREPRVAGMQVLTITPDPPLGTLRTAVMWNPAKIREWIDLGERDAAALLRTDSFSAMLGRFV